MKITDFLMERYAEEWAAAYTLVGVYDALVATIQTGRITMYALAPHFARWDPARIMAECEAKRQVVERLSDVTWGTYAVRDTILGLLALPYVQHPDYEKEWQL